MMGGRTVVRGAFTISSYMEGTGTNLRLPLNPPFTPAEINATYNNIPLPLTDTTDGIVGQGVNPSCAAPTYACYAGAFLRIWDPNVQPAIANQFNLTIQHQLSHATTVQVGYVGQTGHHLMVPYDFAQRVLQPGGATAPSPYFAANLDPLWRTGHGRLESAARLWPRLTVIKAPPSRARSQTETCRTTPCKPCCSGTWSTAFRVRSPTPTPSACPTARDITEPGITPPALRRIGRTSMTSGQSGLRVTTTPRMYCPRMQFTSYPLVAVRNLAGTVGRLSIC